MTETTNMIIVIAMMTFILIVILWGTIASFFPDKIDRKCSKYRNIIREPRPSGKPPFATQTFEGIPRGDDEPFLSKIGLWHKYMPLPKLELNENAHEFDIEVRVNMAYLPYEIHKSGKYITIPDVDTHEDTLVEIFFYKKELGLDKKKETI